MSLVDNERKIKELQAKRAVTEDQKEFDELSQEIDTLTKETYHH